VSHGVLEGDQVSRDELSILDETIAKLPAHSTLGQALASARNSLCDGRPAVISGFLEEVSPSQAAKYLGVSRPTVYKLINSREIPSHMAGSHHRIVMRDLVAYEARRDVARRELAETFAHADAAEASVARRLADVDPATAERLGL
jgi:excisionase family DNA binding protein